MTEHLLVLNSPIYNLQVFLRLISQKYPEIPSVLPDGNYGDATVNAVTAFQEKYNISPTGVTDNETWEKIVAVYKQIEEENTPRNLAVFPEEGVFSEEDSFMPTIMIIQSMIVGLSEKFPNLTKPQVTGSIDESTQNAIKSIQILSALEPDGNITPKFWNVLSMLYEAYVSKNRVENSSEF